MKSLKPSMKENKRYILLNGNFSKEDAEKAILRYIGILGYSKASPVFVSKNILSVKIDEWTGKYNELSNLIKQKLSLIKKRASDELSQQFWRGWLKLNDGIELLKISRQIERLKRLQMVAKGEKLKGWLNREQIQRALAVPIENLGTPLSVPRKNPVAVEAAVVFPALISIVSASKIILLAVPEEKSPIPAT